MELLDLNIGRYQNGDSRLHRVDPRSKVLLFPLMIVACFSASTWVDLLFLTGCASFLFWAGSVSVRSWSLGLRPLRWLILTTVLLHLFFSPGKTLFGTSWLSSDGLLIGIRAATQLCLAMSFAMLLSMTTSLEELTEAFAQLLSPLRRFGVATDRFVDLLGLVLAFVPILREESQTVFKRYNDNSGKVSWSSLLSRGRSISHLLEPLIIRLADRANQMAYRLAAGERLMPVSSLSPMPVTSQVVTSLVCLFIFVWIVL